MSYKKPLVSIIIVTYNSKQWLKTCLTSLQTQIYKNIEIIVVDNASNDGTTEYVEKEFSNIKLIKNKKNLGYAGGINVGLKVARGDFIAILNPDVEIHPEWIIKLLNIAEKFPENGIYASKILNYYKRRLIENVGCNYTLYGTPIIRGAGENDNGQYDYICEIFFASGCAMFINRKVIEEVGYFDDKIFLYGEEDDFCWRARLVGFKVLFVPDAIVYHVRKGITKYISKPKLFYLGRRNRLRVLLKNHRLRILMKVLLIRVLLDIIASLILSARYRNGTPFFLYLKAIFWNLKIFKNTLIERYKVHNKAKVPYKNVEKIMIDKPILIKKKLIDMVRRLE